MQGRPTQDWNDDEAFWNEAWADMDQRLDGKDDRKKAAWWWLLPLLLLLGGIGALLMADTATEEVPAPSVAAKASPGLIVESINAAEHTPQQAQPVAETSPDDPEENETLLIGQPENEVVAPSAPKRNKVSVSATGNLTIPAAPVVVTRSPEHPPEIEPLQQTNPVIEERPDGSVDLLAAKFITTVSRKNLLPEAALVLECQFTSPPSVNYGITAGGQLASGMNVPGYSAGVFATLRADKRISIPVTLRYRRDEFVIGTKNDNGSNADFTAAPTMDGSPFNIDFSASDDFAGRRLDRLSVSGLELETGISVKASSKLRLNLLAGGEYLLGARGVTDLVLQDGVLSARYTGISTSISEFSALGDLLAFNNGNISQVNTSTNRSLGSPAESGLHRWQLRGSLGAEYLLGNRLSVTANYSRMLTPVFTGEVLRIRPNQFGLGLKYRLR